MIQQQQKHIGDTEESSNRTEDLSEQPESHKTEELNIEWIEIDNTLE